jgi:kinesin family protein C1
LGRVKGKLQVKLEEIANERNILQADLGKIRAELVVISDECISLKRILSNQSSSLAESQSHSQVQRMNIESLEAQSRNQQEVIASLETQLTSTRQELQIAHGKLREGETLRRKLHNTVQELKGNIRVFCRVRPLLSSELPPNVDMKTALQHLSITIDENEQEEIKLVQSTESASGNQLSKPYPFTFDKVFDWNAKQRDVFEEISQLVQSALDGYRVCIFAYGQTGSGKTFTMEGSSEDAGMIPLAVQQIFESTEFLKEKGWSFKFEASYLEIYNESIRDLLASKSDTGLKYEIKHVDGQTYVTDLTVQPVTQPGEIMQLLKRAAMNRAVAETQCNEHSSRSHR